MSAKKQGQISEAQENRPEFTMTDEMKTYLGYLNASLEIPVKVDTDDEQRKFKVDYNVWVTRGKPRPKMEAVTTESPIPMKLYRHKVLGIQYMYWRDTHGKIWGRELDAKTNKPKYETKFTKEEAEKLREDAEARCHNPSYYFVDKDGSKYSVSSNHFFAGDFDDIILQHKQRRYNF